MADDDRDSSPPSAGDEAPASSGPGGPRSQARRRRERLRGRSGTGPPSRRVKTAGGSYEFAELENRAFTRLATAMQVVAALQLAAAVLLLVMLSPVARESFALGSVVGLAKVAAAVLVPFLVGVWTFRAGRHLRRIVETEGEDIAHLMRAVEELTKLYILQMWLFFVSMAIVVWGVSTALTALDGLATP